MQITKSLCERLAKILNGTILGIESEQPQYCTLRNVRTFPATILGRRVKEPLANAFLFESTTLKNKTLNLCFLALLPKEVTSIVNQLEREGLQVTSIIDFSNFMKPRVINVYIQSLGNPIDFAKKIRRILQGVKQVANLPPVSVTPAFRRLCNQFASIVGGSASVPFTGTCETVEIRQANIRILGQPASSVGVSLTNFVFTSLDSQGRALCTGSVSLFPAQVKPYLNAIRKQGGLTSSILFTRWFTNPTIYYFTYIAIEKPLLFARKSARALEVLRR